MPRRAWPPAAALSVTITRTFDVPRERVFRALTEAEETLVTIELSEVAGDRTALHPAHAQIPHADYAEFHELGWAHGLGQIAALVERGADEEAQQP